MNSLMRERERRFCLEYAKSGNASKASIEAGYSHVSYGSKLLKREDVVGEIKRLRERKEVDAFQFLKNSQLDVAERLVKIAKEGKEGPAVQAAREVLKDVLVSREEIVSKNEVLHKTPSDAMKELQEAINALSPDIKKDFAGVLDVAKIQETPKDMNKEMPEAVVLPTLNPDPPKPGPSIPDPLHIVETPHP